MYQHLVLSYCDQSVAYLFRFSRRKIILVSFLVAAMGAVVALLLSDKAEHDKGRKLEVSN